MQDGLKEVYLNFNTINNDSGDVKRYIFQISNPHKANKVRYHPRHNTHLRNDYPMASDQNFVDFVLNQIKNAGEISAKKMFGEYGIYADGKLFGLICDNKLFIKPTNSGREFIGNVTEASPHPGAKPSFLIEDKIEDSDWLSELIRISVKELPPPKQKNKNPKSKGNS